MSLFRPYLLRLFLVTCLTLFLAVGVTLGYASPLTPRGDAASMPVNFTAKSLSHDDDAQTVTALGDVELVQGDQILRADKMVYYLAEDKVTAIGNVSLLDSRGDVHFAEYVELHNHMKDGFVQGLLTLLADGSRFTAVEARREDGGRKTTMTEASYTVCKVCEADPQPLWQIKAKQVVHDAKDQSVKYKHARLELLGVPMLYSPIFSHPDPTQKRKSGFLRPQYGWTNTMGTHIMAGYYYAIAPDKDLTLQVQPTTLAGTLLSGEWRQRFVHGQLKANISTANSDRKNEDGTIDTNIQRGHVFADGRYDIDDKWRSGFSLQRASDKAYLRFYDISKDNVLTSQVYAERFSGRHYSRISAYNFQDVRLRQRPEQPDILPMAEHTMIGEPNSLLGGRWEASVSALGVDRQEGNQNVQRGSGALGWERRGVSALGLSTVAHVDGRGDVYDIRNSDAARLDPTRDSDLVRGRGMATASLTSSYPLARRFDNAQAVIEPIGGVSLSPHASRINTDIPNEDSLDTRFDTNNLFQQNKFPGIDRQEDGGRFNYGLKTGLYGDNGRFGKFFVGQSYRFTGDKIFPQGSGLEQRLSDVVGQVKVGISQYLDGDYRFQLANDTLAARRHEIQAGGGNDTIRLAGRYMFIKAVEGTGFNESRQQIGMDGTYNLTRNWQFGASGLVDAGAEPGLRNATTGIYYSDECFTFSIQGSRNVADEATGDNETKVMLRIGFKSIGELSGPRFSVGGNNQARK